MTVRFGDAKLILYIPLFFVASHVQALLHEPKEGDVYEIVQSYETSSTTNGDSSGSSSGHSALIERVIRVDRGGVELEYDEPLEANGKRTGMNWQLPARIYRLKNGVPTLLNIAELEKRVDPWLKEAKLSRPACGHWIFTWNAFKIECDPASALGIIEQFNLWPLSPAEGQLYSDSKAMADVPLKTKSSDSSGSVYIAEFEIDPQKVKIEKAESAVVISKIMKEEKSFEGALAEQDNHQISGTILVTIEVDSSGKITKRTKSTKARIEANGEIETIQSSVILKRNLLNSTDRAKPQ